MANEYMKTAKDLENNNKIENAFKKYKEAANKYMYLYQTEMDPQKKT